MGELLNGVNLQMCYFVILYLEWRLLYHNISPPTLIDFRQKTTF